MFKKVSLVLVSLVVLSSAALAGDSDDLLNELASSKRADIVDAAVEVEDFTLDVDVDELAEDVDGAEDAVEACFRRFGYRSWGRGFGYGYGYRCYRPYYNCYNYYSQPVYNYCRPVISSYWGCF